MESGIEEEWEMVDYYPSLKEEGKEKSQLGWVINAGKKVLIGGVVVSSLPFILPPLVVILALGLALSVPYGVVLASYAFTNKLMTKLLPSPAHQDASFEDVKEIDYEIKGEEEEGYDGNLDTIINDDDDDVVVKNVEIGGGVEEEEEKKQSSSLSDTDVVKTEEGENLLQEKTMVTETKGEEKYENGTKEEEREKLVEENNGEVEKERENLVQDEQVEKINKESSGKRRRKKKNEGKRKEAPQNVELDVEEEDRPVVEEKIEATVQHDSGLGAADAGTGMELKQEKDIATAPLHSQDQEAFGDEKIWEKIDAIREISGFKAPRRDSYYDELKALYLFTGIEAPSTSSDAPADFAEFYSKLCFLMTVIGLK